VAYNYTTVTGSFGSSTGTVTFYSPQITDLTSTNQVQGAAKLQYTLSGGSFTTVPLLCTDNLGLLPAGWVWRVRIALTGSTAYDYTVLLPSNPPTVNLNALPPAPAAITSRGQFLCAPFVYAPLPSNSSAVQLTVSTTTLAAPNVVATTVASGSNGGEISQVASWTSPSAGVLDVATTAGWPSSGTVTVAASGATTATVTYTGFTGSSLTGCAYVSGSPTGTVATGGAVTLTSVVLQTNSFTAPPSGNVIVQVSGSVMISVTNNKLMLALTAAGTVTPVLGYTSTIQVPGGAQDYAFSSTFYVPGLTAGTAYQLALVAATTSSGTAVFYAYGENSTTIGNAGAPLIMTVQAV
jgi:hypothetical protein